MERCLRKRSIAGSAKSMENVEQIDELIETQSNLLCSVLTIPSRRFYCDVSCREKKAINFGSSAGRPHSLRSVGARAPGASFRCAPAPPREPHLPLFVASAVRGPAGPRALTVESRRTSPAFSARHPSNAASCASIRCRVLQHGP